MNAVLFVSDAPALALWRERLRVYEPRWQIRYAASVADAEAVAGTGAVDVVISALQQGEADGLAMLDRIQTESPRTARIVIQPGMTQDAARPLRPMAQQVLGPFCEPTELWSVVERTCCMNGLLENPTIRDLVGGLDRLPSVPRSYVALSQAMERADVSLEEIVAIVEQDSGMALKLLQLANSAFFGRARKTTSLSQAVAYLGLDVLRALALSAQAFAMLEGESLKAYGLEQLQDRSVLTAYLARRFLAARGLAELGFTAGLLQDVGRLVLTVCLKDRYREVIDRARRQQESLRDAEQAAFGVTHAEVGGYLMSLWGLPAELIEAIAFHHKPGGVLHDDTALVDAIHVADAEVEAFVEQRGRARPAVDPLLLERPGMADTLVLWHAMAAQQFAGARS